jgi:hypothetical protein
MPRQIGQHRFKTQARLAFEAAGFLLWPLFSLARTPRLVFRLLRRSQLQWLLSCLDRRAVPRDMSHQPVLLGLRDQGFVYP